jgi:hypothetical protein
MSNPICFGPGYGANSTQITDFITSLDYGIQYGYSGVRFSASLSGQGATTNFDTTYLVQGAQAAHDKGYSYIQVVLNLGPRANGAAVVAANGGVPLPVPHLPSATAVLDIVAGYWQQIVDDLRALGFANSFYRFEGLNEGCLGGNQEPVDSATGNPDTYPLNTHGTAIQDGEYPPQTAISLNYVASRVNFHGCEFCLMTLEGSGTTTAQREVDSITGAAFTTLFGLASITKIATNRYGEVPSVTPYSPTSYKAQFSTRIGEQVTRMRANALIGATLPISLRETGLDFQRVVAGVSPNEIRQDICIQCMAETGIVEAGIFVAVDPSNNTQSGQAFWFKTFAADGTVLWGDAVGPTAVRRSSAWTSGPCVLNTITNDLSSGVESWANPTRAGVADGSFATATMHDNDTTVYLKCLNPSGFSFPANAVVDWILVQIKSKANRQTTSSGHQENVHTSTLKLVKASAIGGTNLMTLGKNIVEDWPTISAIQSYRIDVGESGRTWIPSDFNSGAGVALIAGSKDQDLLSVIASVDYVTITVGGSLSTTPPTNTARFFALF